MGTMAEDRTVENIQDDVAMDVEDNSGIPDDHKPENGMECNGERMEEDRIDEDTLDDVAMDEEGSAQDKFVDLTNAKEETKEANTKEAKKTKAKGAYRTGAKNGRGGKLLPRKKKVKMVK